VTPATAAVRAAIGLNPTISFTIPNAGAPELEHKITAFPEVKQPGIKLKEANVKLAVAGKPLLDTGSSLLMDIDMKGLQEGRTSPSRSSRSSAPRPPTRSRPRPRPTSSPAAPRTSSPISSRHSTSSCSA